MGKQQKNTNKRKNNSKKTARDEKDKQHKKAELLPLVEQSKKIDEFIKR